MSQLLSKSKFEGKEIVLSFSEAREFLNLFDASDAASNARCQIDKKNLFTTSQLQILRLFPGGKNYCVDFPLEKNGDMQNAKHLSRNLK